AALRRQGTRALRGGKIPTINLNQSRALTFLWTVTEGIIAAMDELESAVQAALAVQRPPPSSFLPFSLSTLLPASWMRPRPQAVATATEAKPTTTANTTDKSTSKHSASKHGDGSSTGNRSSRPTQRDPDLGNSSRESAAAAPDVTTARVSSGSGHASSDHVSKSSMYDESFVALAQTAVGVATTGNAALQAESSESRDAAMAAPDVEGVKARSSAGSGGHEDGERGGAGAVVVELTKPRRVGLFVGLLQRRAAGSQQQQQKQRQEQVHDQKQAQPSTPSLEQQQQQEKVVGGCWSGWDQRWRLVAKDWEWAMVLLKLTLAIPALQNTPSMITGNLRLLFAGGAAGRRTLMTSRNCQFGVKYWLASSVVLCIILGLASRPDVEVMRRFSMLYAFLATAVSMTDRVESTLSRTLQRVGGTVCGGAVGLLVLLAKPLARSPVGLMAVVCAVTFLNGCFAAHRYMYGFVLALITVQSMVLCQYGTNCCDFAVHTLELFAAREVSVLIGCTLPVIFSQAVLPWFTSDWALEKMAGACLGAAALVRQLYEQYYMEHLRAHLGYRGVAATAELLRRFGR
ncbi:hypothetical protein Agub_g4558, partial [Astrephomene gubernaculifera]